MELEALAVDDGWSRFIVFLFADPHLLEGGQRRKDGTADPYGVLPLGRSNDLDLHCWWSQCCDLLLHTVGDTWEHCATSRQYGVGVQVLPDVNVTFHDGVVAGFVDTGRLHAQERWLEQGLGATESLVTDGDHLTVGELVALLQTGTGCCCLHLLLEVQGNVAELLLDVTDDFTFGCGGEAVTTLCQDLHQVVGQVTSSQVQTEDGMGKSISLVDGNSVRHTVTRIEHDTSGTTGGVQRQHGLDGYIHGWSVEGLEHDLGHLLPVGLGVEGSLCQKYRVFFGSYTEFVVESVMPDLLHIVPVGHDTVLDGVLQGKDTTLALGLVADVGVLLSHTHHHALVTRSTDDGGEDGTRSIVSSKTGLAHTGSIVYNERSNVIVSHFVLCR